MRLNLLSDAHWESGVRKVLDEFSATGYRRIFEERDYGEGLKGVTVVFVCQDPALNLKKRMRFDKKEKKVYLDVMLDLDEMRQADQELRRKIIADRIREEVPAALGTYSISHFDASRFIEDLKHWVNESL